VAPSTVPERYSQQKALAAALDAANAASKLLLTRFELSRGRALKQWMKSPGALVTDADIESDRVIAETLRKHGVPGRILSEERASGGPDDGLSWLIDPLCGTYPFSTGMVHWGVNIALRRGGQFEVAALALPALGETLAMSRGKGVTRNGRPWLPDSSSSMVSVPSPSTGERQGEGASIGTRIRRAAPPPRVPRSARDDAAARAVPFATAKLSDVSIGLEIDGGETWRRLMRRGLGWVPQCAQVNTFASAAYPLGLTCLGRLSALVIYGVEPVHMAAGAAIALELGLRVTDATGGRIDWRGDGELPVVVAGWPEVHAQLIRAMRA